MAQPQKYERQHNFAADDEINKSALDTEFDNASQSINEIRDKIAQIFTDDDKIQPGLIKAENLADNVFDRFQQEMVEAGKQAQEYADSAARAAEQAKASEENSATNRTAAEAAAQAAERSYNNTTAAIEQSLEQSLSEAKVSLQEEANIQIDRIQSAAESELVKEGISCAEKTWTATSDIAAGTEIVIPDDLVYIVGHHHLRISWNSLVLYSGINFEEVGVTGSESKKFKMTFDVKAGDEINVWIGALGSGDVGEAIRAATLASDSIADLSRKVVYKNEESAS
jgi:hypothetical protein|nr:MAG TPA: hypothetical protein [Caudoviricetes sp.]